MSEFTTIKVGKKEYYVDFRLNKIRNIDNPNDSLSFDEAFIEIENQLSQVRMEIKELKLEEKNLQKSYNVLNERNEE